LLSFSLYEYGLKAMPPLLFYSENNKVTSATRT
jgi:hypothetical protein